MAIRHRADYLTGQTKSRCGGDYTESVPPVPISNTEVKSLKADDSGFSRESR